MVAIVAVDTAENEPFKVWADSIPFSIRLLRRQGAARGASAARGGQQRAAGGEVGRLEAGLHGPRHEGLSAVERGHCRQVLRPAEVLKERRSLERREAALRSAVESGLRTAEGLN